MSITTNGNTTTIDSSENSAAIAAATLAANVIITKDSGTPPGDPVVVDMSALVNLAAIASITIDNGATGIIGSGLIGGTVATTINLNGGLLDVQNALLNAGALNTVNVGSNGGEIKVEPGLTLGLLNVPVNFTNGVPASFKLDFPSSTSIPALYNPINNTTTIGDGVGALGVLSVGRVVTLTGNVFNIPLNTVSGTYSMNFTTAGGYGDGTGGVITCFLPGTAIETPHGEVAIENLRVGDEIIAIEHGARVRRSIVWAGRQHVDLAQVANPEDYRPVRVCRDAIADGIPNRDLLVTPEHCLCFDGKLIPVRMLINGRSILSDSEMTSFDFHHVETAEHSILLANGALSESYLDTGNRASFTPDGSVVVAFPTLRKSWAQDAAVPLAADRATVEPVWHALDLRARNRGLAATVRELERVADPDLRLQTDTGAQIRPVLFDGRVHAFVVPAGTRRVRLLSRASRPSDTIGPFLDDRRELGVLVGTIGVSDGRDRRTVTAHLCDVALDGWHAMDNGADRRWTGGNAALPIDLGPHRDRPIFLDIDVRTMDAYLVGGERDALLVSAAA